MSTPEEKVFLRDAFNAFLDLPAEHSADQSDFCFHIHALQNIVLSREGYRAYKRREDKNLKAVKPQ
jgi:hypothetical protein